MQEPRSQHQVTEEGPPRSIGVLNVVATLEQRPMMLNAKLICAIVSLRLSREIYWTYRSKVRELATERWDVSHVAQETVIVQRACEGVCLSPLHARRRLIEVLGFIGCVVRRLHRVSKSLSTDVKLHGGPTLCIPLQFEFPTARPVSERTRLKRNQGRRFPGERVV